MSILELTSPINQKSRLATLATTSRRIHEGERRFDAAYYEGNWAELTIEASPYPHRQLRELADVWFPGRFVRNYRPTGTPFIGSREMLFWPLRPEKHLAANHPNVGKLHVRTGDILVRRSGSVGATVRVTDDFAGVAVSEHALRVEPKEGWGDYLYALMRSSLGQAIMQRKAFGAVVNELDPEHLLSIPVPIPPDEVLSQITSLMARARSLQSDGAQLIKEAQRDLLLRLDLRPVEELEPKYLVASSNQRIRAFSVPSSGLRGRFDGSFHRPEIQAVREALYKAHTDVAPLATRSEIQVPGRFKRVYVEPELGAPFLQGVHVPMVRPEGIKYLSISENKRQLSTHRLNAGSVLVTCSGTLGRVGMVTKAQDGWTGSQHIARINTLENTNAGYVYAFLATEYGQQQILGQTYGAVVDELTEGQLGSVEVPWLDDKDQSAIGNPVLLAFEKRDEAIECEDAAIALLRATIG